MLTKKQKNKLNLVNLAVVYNYKYTKNSKFLKLLPKKKFFLKKRKKFFLKKSAQINNIFLKKKFLKLLPKTHVFIFYRKLFNSFNKSGKKNLSISNFIAFLNLVLKNKLKFNQFKKTSFLFTYFYKIVYNIHPLFVYTNLYLKGENLLLPWLRPRAKINKFKLIRIAVAWVKFSILKRKEKTLFLKMFSELEDIKLFKGESINAKKQYFSNFFQNKKHLKRLNSRQWI